MKDFKKEKKMWVDFVNFYYWGILKACLKERNIRGLISNGFSNPNTLEKYVNRLVSMGLLEERRARVGKSPTPSRFLKTTPLGYELLSAYDKIGEIVKKIRKSSQEVISDETR
jgi:predicted transcriptional regulator